MQQKKYSFNYLIFKQDFIKRRMLVNPATHPVGVSVSEQTLPQCDQQVDNAVPGFTQKLQHPGRKTEPGNGVVKTFPDGITKSLLCVIPGLFRAVFPPDM